MGQDASRHGEVQIDSALFTHYDGEKQLRRSRANRLSLSSSIKCVVSINDYLIIVSTADGTLLLIDIRETFINYVGYYWDLGYIVAYAYGEWYLDIFLD